MQGFSHIQELFHSCHFSFKYSRILSRMPYDIYFPCLHNLSWSVMVSSYLFFMTWTSFEAQSSSFRIFINLFYSSFLLMLSLQLWHWRKNGTEMRPSSDSLKCTHGINKVWEWLCQIHHLFQVAFLSYKVIFHLFHNQ